MAKHPKLSADQLATILSHNRIMVRGAQSLIAKILVIPPERREEALAGMLAYNESIIKVLTWSDGLARQRAGGKPHG